MVNEEGWSTGWCMMRAGRLACPPGELAVRWAVLLVLLPQVPGVEGEGATASTAREGGGEEGGVGGGAAGRGGGVGEEEGAGEEGGGGQLQLAQSTVVSSVAPLTLVIQVYWR